MGELFPSDSEVQLTEYPLFDSLLNGVGESGLTAQTPLFSGGTLNKPQLTNMQQAAQIPGGGVFFITGMRAVAFFMSLADTEYTVAYGTIAANTFPTSSPARMLDLYNVLAYSAQVTLTIDQFPAMIVPWYMLPAGGGVSGQSTVQGRSIVSMGMPTKEAAGKFTKPLKIGALSAFQTQVNLYAFGKSSIAGGFTGIAQGGTLVADFDPISLINQADGIKLAQIVLPGFITRKLGGKT